MIKITPVILLAVLLSACVTAVQPEKPESPIRVDESKVKAWPEPNLMEGVPRIVGWDQLYQFMDMSPEWAASMPESPSGWETPGLFDYFLQGPMREIDEVVYAIRQSGKDWHWYANFGYMAGNPDRKSTRLNSSHYS